MTGMVEGELAVERAIDGVMITWRYGDVFHPPGELYGVVMIPTSGFGPKWVGCYKRSARSGRWRRMAKQHNDPGRALKAARDRADNTGNRTRNV